MDNDDALVGTIHTRRDALRLAAKSGLALAAASLFGRRAFADITTPQPAAPTSQPAVHLVASPVMTEGPFFVDEKLNRSNLLGDTKRAAVTQGLPLALAFRLYKLTDQTATTLPNAMIDVWHADTSGAYSDESNPMNREDTSKQTWLRGYQLTDATGKANFQTIVPGWYEGRTAHIHFKVRQLGKDGKADSEFTSQLFFSDADSQHIFSQAPYAARGIQQTANANDDIFSERLPDGSIAGKIMTLALLPAPTGRGHSAEFAIMLTDASMHAGSGHFGPGPGGRRGPGDPDFDGPPPW